MPFGVYILNLRLRFSIFADTVRVTNVCIIIIIIILYLGWPKEASVRWGTHWRNLQNMTEPFMCGGDAAFSSNYSDHLLDNCHTVLKLTATDITEKQAFF